MYTLADLVDDVLLQIFDHFKLREMPLLMVVCKHWKMVIDSNDTLWKKYVPRLIPVDLLESQTNKLALKQLFKNSIKVGLERWFPNPYPLLNLRAKLIYFCNQYGFFKMEQTDARFALYIRLNPTYDFVDGHKNVELTDIIEEIWDTFGERDEDEEQLSSVDDVITHSIEVDFTKLLEVFHNGFCDLHCIVWSIRQ